MITKFVLVKSYYGLGGDICVLLGAMDYAIRTRRRLVAHWEGGLYGVSDKPLFSKFFSNPDVEGLEVIPENLDSVFPEVWKDYIFSPPLTYVQGLPLTLSKPEDVKSNCDAQCIVITRDSRHLNSNPEVYYKLADKLTLVPEVQQRVDKFSLRFKPFKKVIGLHYRHGNGEKKVIPPDPLWFTKSINKKLQEWDILPQDVLIFVSTDCGSSLEYFKEYYPNCVDVPKDYLPSGQGALHIKRHDLTNDEKVELGREALVDMYCLRKVDYFIGSGGYFSLFVKLLRSGIDCLFYTGCRKFDDYRFSETYYPIEKEPHIRDQLSDCGHPVDGIFIKLINDAREIYYYDKLIFSGSRNDLKLSTKDLLMLRESLTRYRIY